MKCPICQNSTQVSNSRSADHGRAIKRRRVCPQCDRRFTTYERIELFGLEVQKRGNEKQPYLRHKLELGLRKAIEKRPVSEEQFQKVVALIENDIFNLEKDTVSSEQIGQIVLSHLRTLDKVAYLRFVSVHRNFKSTKAFEKEIEKLEKLGRKNTKIT
ncbi:MAG: transcriptional regulator NrdR [bacterium]|nr:transcriptional regulator NrdR [bacterium]